MESFLDLPQDSVRDICDSMSYLELNNFLKSSKQLQSLCGDILKKKNIKLTLTLQVISNTDINKVNYSYVIHTKLDSFVSSLDLLLDSLKEEVYGIMSVYTQKKEELTMKEFEENKIDRIISEVKKDLFEDVLVDGIYNTEEIDFRSYDINRKRSQKLIYKPFANIHLYSEDHSSYDKDYYLSIEPLVMNQVITKYIFDY